MPQPLPYTRLFSFTDFQASNPSAPPPGYRLDADFNGIASTLVGVLGNLRLIQRDDGKLADGCITIDAMSPELMAALAPVDGVDGTDAAAPNISVTAHTVAPGGAATASLTGAYPNLNIDLGLPRGAPAAPGEATLPDADYGDVLISASGTHMKVETVLDGQVPATTTDLATKLSVAAPVVTGANLWINTNKLIVQHDGANGYIRAQVGNLTLGAGGANTFLLTPAGDAGLAATLTLSDGNVVIAGNTRGVFFKDANGGTPALICQADNNLVLYGTSTTGALRGILSVLMHSNTSVVAFNGTPTAPTAAPGDNSIKLATTGYVQGELAGVDAVLAAHATAIAAKADAFTGVSSFAADFGITDVHNGAYIRMTGATTRTITFNTPTAGNALILVNRGTAGMTIACPGGYYKNGGAIASTNLTLAPNGKLMAFHEGGGVWTFDGTGF